MFISLIDSQNICTFYPAYCDKCFLVLKSNQTVNLRAFTSHDDTDLAIELSSAAAPISNPHAAIF